MVRTRSPFYWLLPFLALLTLSLVHQFYRPQTLGQRAVSWLQRSPVAPRLRGALPLRQIPATPAAESSVALHRASLSGADGDFWEGPGFTLRRPHESPLLRQILNDTATRRTMEELLYSLGYVNQKPHDLFTRARDELLALSDEGLLHSFLRADIALLQQADDPAVVTRTTLLLTVWDPTGIAACVDIPTGGRLYAVETLASAASDSWILVVLRFDYQGAERWHGVLHVPRFPAVPVPLPLLVQTLEQLEAAAPPADSTPQIAVPLLTQPPH